jgi:uncharacterized protein (DUF1499 family)
MVIKILVAIVVAAAIFFIIRLTMLGKDSRNQTPTTLGTVDGKLTECPKKPNCVSTSSQGKDHNIDLLNSSFEAPAAVSKLIGITQSLGGVLKKQDENYLHFEFESGLFRFVDDVEFFVSSEGIQMRSASRVGHSDLGANRKRIDKIVELFEKN